MPEFDYTTQYGELFNANRNLVFKDNLIENTQSGRTFFATSYLNEFYNNTFNNNSSSHGLVWINESYESETLDFINNSFDNTNASGSHIFIEINGASNVSDNTISTADGMTRVFHIHTGKENLLVSNNSINNITNCNQKSMYVRGNNIDFNSNIIDNISGEEATLEVITDNSNEDSINITNNSIENIQVNNGSIVWISGFGINYDSNIIKNTTTYGTGLDIAAYGISSIINSQIVDIYGSNSNAGCLNVSEADNLTIQYNQLSNCETDSNGGGIYVDNGFVSILY